MIEPSKLQSSSRKDFWLNKLLAFCKAGRLREGPGYKVKRTPEGTIIKLDDRGGGGSDGPIWV